MTYRSMICLIAVPCRTSYRPWKYPLEFHSEVSLTKSHKKTRMYNHASFQRTYMSLILPLYKFSSTKITNLPQNYCIKERFSDCYYSHNTHHAHFCQSPFQQIHIHFGAIGPQESAQITYLPEANPPPTTSPLSQTPRPSPGSTARAASRSQRSSGTSTSRARCCRQGPVCP